MKTPTPMRRWIAYFPEPLLEEVDAWAEKNGLVKRADAMRQLLRKALDAEKDAGKRLTSAERGALGRLRAATQAASIEEAATRAANIVENAMMEAEVHPEPEVPEGAQAKPKRGRTLRSLF